MKQLLKFFTVWALGVFSIVSAAEVMDIAEVQDILSHTTTIQSAAQGNELFEAVSKELAARMNDPEFAKTVQKMISEQTEALKMAHEMNVVTHPSDPVSLASEKGRGVVASAMPHRRHGWGRHHRLSRGVPLTSLVRTYQDNVRLGLSSGVVSQSEMDQVSVLAAAVSNFDEAAQNSRGVADRVDTLLQLELAAFDKQGKRKIIPSPSEVNALSQGEGVLVGYLEDNRTDMDWKFVAYNGKGERYVFDEKHKPTKPVLIFGEDSGELTRVMVDVINEVASSETVKELPGKATSTITKEQCDKSAEGCAVLRYVLFHNVSEGGLRGSTGEIVVVTSSYGDKLAGGGTIGTKRLLEMKAIDLGEEIAADQIYRIGLPLLDWDKVKEFKAGEFGNVQFWEIDEGSVVENIYEKAKEFYGKVMDKMIKQINEKIAKTEQKVAKDIEKKLAELNKKYENKKRTQEYIEALEEFYEKNLQPKEGKAFWSVSQGIRAEADGVAFGFIEKIVSAITSIWGAGDDYLGGYDTYEGKTNTTAGTAWENELVNWDQRKKSSMNKNVEISICPTRGYDCFRFVELEQ